jgi:Protein of unknown function (DUF3577)
MSNATTNQTAQATQATQAIEYIDCLTKGIGYASRIRRIEKSSDGKRLVQPFWSVKINMMSGQKGAVDYLAYDVKSTSKEIDDLLAQFKVIADETKIVDGQEMSANRILFRATIGDAYPHAYTLTRGPRAGEQRLEMKGRLVRIHSILVNGETVYREPAKEAAPQPMADAVSPQDQGTGTNG